jgi:hypothetical protein
LRQAGARVNAKVLVALGANIQIFFDVFFPDDLAAVLTFDPQTFGADILLPRIVHFAGLSFEPSH